MFQKTAHFAGAPTASASGFQAPCIIILDMLLGVDHSTLTKNLQQFRDDHIEDIPEVISLLFSIVRSGGKALREFIGSVPSKEKRIELNTAFNAIGEELLMWRSSHRARAGKFVEASNITTSRTNEEMGGDVHGTFLREMSTIIAATKATLI
jgi:hypothetical protein